MVTSTQELPSMGQQIFSCLCGNRLTPAKNQHILRGIAHTSCWTILLHRNQNCGALSTYHWIVYCVFRAGGTLPLVTATYDHTSHHWFDNAVNDFFGDRTISWPLWPPRSADLTLPHYYLWGYQVQGFSKFTTSFLAFQACIMNVIKEI